MRALPILGQSGCSTRPAARTSLRGPATPPAGGYPMSALLPSPAPRPRKALWQGTVSPCRGARPRDARACRGWQGHQPRHDAQQAPSVHHAPRGERIVVAACTRASHTRRVRRNAGTRAAPSTACAQRLSALLKVRRLPHFTAHARARRHDWTLSCGRCFTHECKQGSAMG